MLIYAFDVIGGYGDKLIHVLHIISNDPMSGAGSNHYIHVLDKGGVTD